MNAIRTLVGLAMILSLSACMTSDPATRSANVPSSAISVAGKNGGAPVVLAAQFNVAEIRVSVPQDLKVSEANLFYPVADIVWRGEPRGDRHAQVKAIFDEAMATGTAAMTSGPAVIVEARVTRFHCLTEKTRYTIGGTHSLRYELTVRDAATGAVIDGPRPVVADVKGAGGDAAIAEEMAGRTQRVVVVEALAASIRRELSTAIAPPPPTSRNDAPAAITTVSQLY
jgi:hypothetical protein